MKSRKTTMAGMMRPIITKIMKTMVSIRDKFVMMDFLNHPSAKVEVRKYADISFS